MQLAVIVDPGDRAAAIADLDQIDDRHHDRIARRCPVALDPVVGHDLDPAVLDQRAFRRRAANVEREHVGLADQLSEFGRAPEARCGSGFDHGDRNARDRLQRIDAAIGLHDVGASGKALRSQALIEPAQIALGDGLHIGRQDGRVGALIFAPFAGDLVRGDGRRLRPEPAHRVERGLFMRRIGVGVQETDGDRLDALGLEVIEDRRQAGYIEGAALLAPVGHAAGQFAAQIARHEGFGLAVVQVEEVGPVAARDLQRVAEAPGRDQADLDALALGQRVDHDRGAMGEKVDRRRIDAPLFEHVQHALFEIGRCGVRLGGADMGLAGRFVGLEDDQIGKGSADICGNAGGLRRHGQAPLADR